MHYFIDTEYSVHSQCLFFLLVSCLWDSLTCSIHWWCDQPPRDSASPSVWHSLRQVPPVIPRPLWYPHSLQINSIPKANYLHPHFQQILISINFKMWLIHVNIWYLSSWPFLPSKRRWLEHQDCIQLTWLDDFPVKNNYFATFWDLTMECSFTEP